MISKLNADQRKVFDRDIINVITSGNRYYDYMEKEVVAKIS